MAGNHATHSGLMHCCRNHMHDIAWHLAQERVALPAFKYLQLPYELSQSWSILNRPLYLEYFRSPPYQYSTLKTSPCSRPPIYTTLHLYPIARICQASKKPIHTKIKRLKCPFPTSKSPISNPSRSPLTYFLAITTTTQPATHPLNPPPPKPTPNQPPSPNHSTIPPTTAPSASRAARPSTLPNYSSLSLSHRDHRHQQTNPRLPSRIPTPTLPLPPLLPRLPPARAWRTAVPAP